MIFVEQVVRQDYCIGCGLCAAMCPNNALRMGWNRYGTFEPVETQATCSECLTCVYVCPFADGLVDNVSTPNEDALGWELFGHLACNHCHQLGFYQTCYAGHVPTFRQDSTSGGIATWILSYLLETRQVDKVICVHPSDTKGTLFQYRVCSTVKEVRLGAKTRYYPVHSADVLNEVLNNEARYALVALPCTIKGIRLAQRLDAILRGRIVFCVGLFCTSLKTAYFTEYLAACVQVYKDNIVDAQYRIKSEGPGNWDYSFGCATLENRDEFHTDKAHHLGDVWGMGLFKPNACDYCDDVASELADLSAGDTWIPPYMYDWRGNNIVITRSALAQQLIEEGIKKGLLLLDKISPEQVVESLALGLEHRRRGLAYRLYRAKREGRPVPNKRVQPRLLWNPVLAKVYRLRMRVSDLSHKIWLSQRETSGKQLFDREIQADLAALQRWTCIAQRLRSVLDGLTSVIRRLDLSSGYGQ